MQQQTVPKLSHAREQFPINDYRPTKSYNSGNDQLSGQRDTWEKKPFALHCFPLSLLSLFHFAPISRDLSQVRNRKYNPPRSSIVKVNNHYALYYTLKVLAHFDKMNTH